MAREKLPPNNINNNNINIINDLNLKNKYEYTEQDDIEIAKVKTMLLRNNRQ